RSARRTPCARPGRRSRPPAVRWVRRSPGDLRVVGLEVLVLDLADLDRTHDAVAVDVVALRPADDEIAARDLLVEVRDRRPGGAHLLDEVVREIRFLAQDADDLQAVRGLLLELVDEERELLAARHACRVPEVDDDRVALARREI